ncbi:peptidoglycan editing factor PgeF [bacterium]|nr:peptidoglycan editing factor PgeF [bacterium]
MFKEKFLEKGVVYYSDLIPELEHYFTTREINVEDNIEFWSKYLHLNKEDIIKPTQTHSANIDIVKDGIFDYPDTDSLIITNKKQAIYMRFADCTPVILYDKKANIAAGVHAGWRGTAQSILPKTVKKIIEYSNSSYNDIYAVVGPAIGQCCYEVGNEVSAELSKTINTNNGLITDDNLVDLKGINAQQLIELGIPNENIDICPFCTSCRNDLFFSYRKESGTQKRHNLIIKLK